MHLSIKNFHKKQEKRNKKETSTNFSETSLPYREKQKAGRCQSNDPQGLFSHLPRN
jgi:hypothetical protein